MISAKQDHIKLYGIIDTDLINYKKISMVLEFPTCSFKCNKEYGSNICQNYQLAKYKPYDFKISDILDSYKLNTLTEAILYQGLEPFDSFLDLYNFTEKFRELFDDDIVIYTGYYESEISQYLDMLKQFENIIVKFGRYIPNQKSHYDKILGVYLSSDNQYSLKLS